MVLSSHEQLFTRIQDLLWVIEAYFSSGHDQVVRALVYVATGPGFNSSSRQCFTSLKQKVLNREQPDLKNFELFNRNNKNEDIESALADKLNKIKKSVFSYQALLSR